MTQKTITKTGRFLRMGVLVTLPALLGLFLLSFTAARNLANDFLKQLGISQKDADAKIISGFMHGSLDQFGLRNAKNIALGKRGAVTRDLLNYVKKYVGSAVFVKEYNTLRESKKPVVNTLKTPEEMQKEMIANAQQSVKEMEASLKKADASMKAMFEKLLADAKKQAKDAENPNNKMIVTYRKNYQQGVKDAEAGNRRLLAGWEAEYPANHQLYVKARLQQFLEETKDIDFNAELTQKNGKKVFVNRAYESKGNRWKMAFRAGKDVVETARSFAQQWITELP
jgi:vacuolar-type H+-ATPase subunit H